MSTKSDIWLLVILSCSRILISGEYNDTLLSCYICMEEEYAEVKEKCDENMPDHISCVFTRDLLNWNDVMKKLDSQVTFKCLLFYYKGKGSAEVQSKRGCIAEYEDYSACENIGNFVNFKQNISCLLCTESYCNSGFKYEEIDESMTCSPHMFDPLLPTIMFYLQVSLIYF